MSLVIRNTRRPRRKVVVWQAALTLTAVLPSRMTPLTARADDTLAAGQAALYHTRGITTTLST